MNDDDIQKSLEEPSSPTSIMDPLPVLTVSKLDKSLIRNVLASSRDRVKYMSLKKLTRDASKGMFEDNAVVYDTYEMKQEDVFMVCYSKKSSLLSQGDAINANVIRNKDDCKDDIWVYPYEELCRRMHLLREWRLERLGQGWKKVDRVPSRGRKINIDAIEAALGEKSDDILKGAIALSGFHLNEAAFKHFEWVIPDQISPRSYFEYSDNVFVPVDVAKINNMLKKKCGTSSRGRDLSYANK